MVNHNKPETVGVLLMAYGSPESLNQIEDYLIDVRGGRVPSPELIDEIKGRYEKIGGRSPLLERTTEQAEKLVEELNKRNQSESIQYRGYVGMRHWEPRIHEVVQHMAQDGIKRAVSMVMAPHNSNMSIGKYYEVLDAALEGQQIEFNKILSWHIHPGFLNALSEKIAEALGWFKDEPPYVIFTAHSLPTKIIKMGDPYDDQLNETAKVLAEKHKLKKGQWRFCYQSAGASSIPWLGPPVEEVVEELAKAGKKNLLGVPIGFVCDHVEVLYDIDIETKGIANQFGARLERSPSLNASPAFINGLADLIEENLATNNQGEK